MKSRYSHVLMLLAAIAAFLPVLAVDFMLDGYVRGKESQQLQMSLDSMTMRIQGAANEAIISLRRILADSPSLCTPTFIDNVHEQMQTSLFLRQVVVESGDGVQYCDGFARNVIYAKLSEQLSLPGRTETLTVVTLGERALPALKITQAFGAERSVSAFVSVLGQGARSLLYGLKPATSVRLSLTNGTTVLATGDVPAGTDVITATSFAGDIPIKAEATIPFAVARADYVDLDVGFTLMACLMSGSFLLLALHYVRRSKLPAFDIERAIAAGEIKPYYQPVINLSNGRVAGCEVLCRWVKKNGQVVMPGAFIEFAEATGLAIPMTLSLMQQVRTDLSSLCLDMPDLKVSINLFEGHFRDSSIVDDVQAIFGSSHINFSQLTFEITERRPLANSTETLAVIAGLHKLGSKLAMDDAGTGHSNLAYLQTLGFDVIKIDRIFVDMVKPDSQQVPVLDALIAMAKDLGTEIVAEGVETEAQAIYLRNRGVVMAQGFLFAPAIKAPQFRALATALNKRPTPAPALIERAA
ncbi:MAG: hypothetical protein JWR75_496 [Devosia sp.]|nr:hypothetical protein [Devosia sp.]